MTTDFIGDILKAAERMRVKGEVPTTIRMSYGVYKRIKSRIGMKGNAHQRRVARRINARKNKAFFPLTNFKITTG